MIVEILSTRYCIFPIMQFDFKSEDDISLINVQNATYLGTGFFLNLGAFVCFITARHVVEVECNKLQRIGFARLENNGTYWFNKDWEYHPVCDLAYIRLQMKEIPDFVKPLNIYRGNILLQGTEVESFGFPLTQKEHLSDECKITMIINQISFRGYIASHYNKQNLGHVFKAFSENYALSFECLRGLSGAPLMFHDGSKVLVCGIIYGNRTTHFSVDSYEVKQSSETIRCETVKQYNFGLASTHRELLEIPACINAL